MSDLSFNTVSLDVFGMFTRNATFDDAGEYFDKPVPIRRQNAFSDSDKPLPITRQNACSDSEKPVPIRRQNAFSDSDLLSSKRKRSVI
jgi:hypothetical protein